MTVFLYARERRLRPFGQDLTVRKVRTGELRAEPQKVSAQFLTKCLKEDQAQRLSKAFQEQHLVDSQGFLREDPRHRRWIATAESVLGFDAPDSLVADESCLAEVMNVAWAKHEFTAQFAEEIFDFCEGKELKLAQMAPGWKTELGPIEAATSSAQVNSQVPNGIAPSHL
eukprot:g21618.t1